jgi:hypothetical protein
MPGNRVDDLWRNGRAVIRANWHCQGDVLEGKFCCRDSRWQRRPDIPWQAISIQSIWHRLGCEHRRFDQRTKRPCSQPAPTTRFRGFLHLVRCRRRGRSWSQCCSFAKCQRSCTGPAWRETGCRAVGKFGLRDHHHAVVLTSRGHAAAWAERPRPFGIKPGRGRRGLRCAGATWRAADYVGARLSLVMLT